MSKLKHLARLGVVAILATGAFAGISGPANAEPKTDQIDTSHLVTFMDTGWG